VLLVTIWWLKKLGKDWQLTIIKEFDVERFNLRKLSDLEVRKHQMKTSNRSAALEIINDSEDIKWAWENIKLNIKSSAKDSLGLYELKQHKEWFNE